MSKNAMARTNQSRRHRILVVDDSDSFRQLLASFLRRCGHIVDEVWSVEAAERSSQLIRPDLAIVDIELGEADGFQFLRFLNGTNIASMVVSIRSDVADRIAGLELGATDYMVKPIDLRELELRVDKILKTLADPGFSQFVTVGDVMVDLVNRQIFSQGRSPKSLPPKEFLLFRKLLESNNKIVDRTVLSREILSRVPDSNSRALDVLVSKLRLKIDTPGARSLIKAVRGSGYMLVTKHAD